MPRALVVAPDWAVLRNYDEFSPILDISRRGSCGISKTFKMSEKLIREKSAILGEKNDTKYFEIFEKNVLRLS